MRRFIAALMVVALFSVPALATEDQAATLGQLREQVQELRQRVEALKKRVEQLEEKLSEQPAGPMFPVHEGWRKRGPDLEALQRIQLPEDPTPEEVRQYVRRIAAASEGQGGQSSTDPQVAMIQRVGRENVDVLLGELSYGRWSATDLYLTEAIKRLAGPQHKEEILNHLAGVPELASIVLRYGWEDDARETLIAELEEGGRYLPREWLVAVAKLGDKEALDALKSYFLEGRNRDTTFEVLWATPGVGDLSGPVAKAWERARAEGGDEALDMAQVAVGYGHRDALEILIDFLARGYDPRGSMRFVRRAVILYTEARGTNDQIVRWYRQNKDDLHWEAEARKFRAASEE